MGRKEEKKEKWGGREERNEGEAGGGKKGKGGWRIAVREEKRKVGRKEEKKRKGRGQQVREERRGKQRKMIMQCPISKLLCKLICWVTHVACSLCSYTHSQLHWQRR